jgi:predicted AlkP superfamily phosphohydrolase/phosphomutase
MGSESRLSKRTVMIGLDGMPFGLIRDLAANGTMANTAQLIEDGSFRCMESSIPDISSVAWSSIITGTNPAEHGIFGFTDVAQGTYRLIYPSFDSLKALPFWERKGSGNSVILNVPSTFPARPLSGTMVSGFVALDLERATYPRSFVPFLVDADYRVDVDSRRAQQSVDLFLRELDRTLRARITVYRHLWEREDWNTFVLVFTGTDRLAHFLWDAYEDDQHRYHAAFLNHLYQIDQVIGEIARRTTDLDALVLLSDHGFEALHTDIYLNCFLRQQGFLKVKRDPPRGTQDIEEGTTVFALDPGRMYVNVEGRYPRGSVHPSDRPRVLKDLRAALGTLEVGGERVVRQLHYREEIYEGPWLQRAPDLVMLAEAGFNLRGSMRAQQLTGRGMFTGKHSQHDAFLLVRGELAQEVMPCHPKVSDVVSIIDGLRQRGQQ